MDFYFSWAFKVSNCIRLFWSIYGCWEFIFSSSSFSYV